MVVVVTRMCGYVLPSSVSSIWSRPRAYHTQEAWLRRRVSTSAESARYPLLSSWRPSGTWGASTHDAT